MRGNEIDDTVRLFYPGPFTIPMRGNENTNDLLTLAADSVYDPHEG